MALGGGTWTVQNKKLPGAYINVVSAAMATAALSDRGIATMPVELDWGCDDGIFEVTAADFQKNSLKIFGYSYDSDKLKGLSDLFMNATKAYLYRLNGNGVKASNDYATALYSGVRGNEIMIAIHPNADDSTLWDVSTYVGGTKADTQTVASADKLEANDWVTFKSFEITTEVAGEYLENGTNGEMDGSAYQAYLNLIESYTYNTMGLAVADDDTTKRLYASFNERLRDQVGAKQQLVLYNYPANYMGVINVKNPVLDEGENEAAMVYWVTGAEAGCAVNRSLQNTQYDGVFTPYVDYTQTELESCIDNGEFVFHRVDDAIRVLSDINSMVDVTEDCGEIFKDNQTVRVVDQFANDIATTFNTKYLGVVQNNAAGRLSLWSDVKKLLDQLATLGAIEDFDDSDITVEAGDTKKSVLVTVSMEVVNAMDKMYMTVTVS